VAYDIYGNRLDYSWSFTIPWITTYYRIPVSLGWNLISVPLIKNNTALPTALNDLNGDTTWDRIMWYNPNDSGDHWKQFNKNWNPTLNDLTKANRTMGFWINVLTVGDGYINISGSTPLSTVIQLRSGLNLIGYSADNDNTYTVGQLKSVIGATFVEGFSAIDTYRTKVLSDSYILKKGAGYWVYVTADTVWTVDW
jgi:hypothetical protein